MPALGWVSPLEIPSYLIWSQSLGSCRDLAAYIPNITLQTYSCQICHPVLANFFSLASGGEGVMILFA